MATTCPYCGQPAPSGYVTCGASECQLARVNDPERRGVLRSANIRRRPALDSSAVCPRCHLRDELVRGPDGRLRCDRCGPTTTPPSPVGTRRG